MSRRSNDAPFSPPRLRLELPDYSRAEWERIKREVDQAFDAFEKTWPADSAGEPSFVDGRAV